ncbi:MAG: PLDc N-terminal domain-containing protein [Marinobacter adhaerens]|nr:PLDc N-terminal domain-containing protein [Marinobacter adhaerens]
MEGSDLNMTIAFFIVSIGWLLPIIIILRSNRTSGGEKLAWILLIIFVSWLAWIFYWLLAPIKKS